MAPLQYDTVILGAGAAGMMCAAQAKGRVLVADHAKAPGEKIRISGGGRCNFTNLYSAPDRFLSQNPHFAKSALSRYSQWDFIELVSRYGIAWHEKTLGQLFCDGSAKEIIAMLQAEMDAVGVDLWLKTEVGELAQRDGQFHIELTREGRSRRVIAKNIVVATGGKSIPKMGATGLAYQIARQFGHEITETRAGLVPFTFGDDRTDLKSLAGVATNARVTANGVSFDEAVLFTHRGLSGPAILQASSYWREGETITLNLIAKINLAKELRQAKHDSGAKSMATILADHLPKRLAGVLADNLAITGNLADQSGDQIDALVAALSDWRLKPSGTEGYRTAEVTVGGISTSGISSKTMMSEHVPGLYFIGEAVDVTGWLGGYNFQWAWSSGWAAGQAISDAE